MFLISTRNFPPDIGGMQNSLDSPWYVIDKDIKQNSLYVSQNQSPLFYSGEIELININFINKSFNNDNIKVRFRHGGMLRDCDLKIANETFVKSLLVKSPS